MISRILSLSFHELGLAAEHNTCKETLMHMFMEQASVNYTAFVFVTFKAWFILCWLCLPATCTPRVSSQRGANKEFFLAPQESPTHEKKLGSQRTACCHVNKFKWSIFAKGYGRDDLDNLLF